MKRLHLRTLVGVQSPAMSSIVERAFARLNGLKAAVVCAMNAEATTRAKFSFPSIIAIVAAIASFAVGAFWGFVLAVVALVFGAIGVLLAFSSRVRGGIVSVFAVLAGIVGLIAAIFKGVAWLL